MSEEAMNDKIPDSIIITYGNEQFGIFICTETKLKATKMYRRMFMSINKKRHSKTAEEFSTRKELNSGAENRPVVSAASSLTSLEDNTTGETNKKIEQ